MKTLITCIFTIFTMASIHCQTSGQIANYNSPGNPASAANAQLSTILGPIQEANGKLKNQEIAFKGSPYTADVFLPTKLYYDDELMGDLFYRYNAFNEEIEIKKTNLEEESIRGLSRDKKIVIINNGKPMFFKTFIDKSGRTQNGYLTQLIDGEYNLFKRVDVKYTEGQKAQNSFVPAVPARFSKYTEYYIEIEGINRIDEVELKNKKLINLVKKDKKDVLKAFLKESRLKIKSEGELLKAITFLNN
jgi:hypothetical protein